MDQQEIISGFERRAAALKLPIGEICQRAAVHPTTFSRWKLSEKNPDPISATMKSLQAIEVALAAEEEARRIAA